MIFCGAAYYTKHIHTAHTSPGTKTRKPYNSCSNVIPLCSAWTTHPYFHKCLLSSDMPFVFSLVGREGGGDTKNIAADFLFKFNRLDTTISANRLITRRNASPNDFLPLVPERSRRRRPNCDNFAMQTAKEFRAWGRTACGKSLQCTVCFSPRVALCTFQSSQS